MNKGFTLIELLVVVLIIGILSAIALPQYQKAVERSRMAEAVQVLGDLAIAQSVFYMQHGYYVDNLDELNEEGDVQIQAPSENSGWELLISQRGGAQTMTRVGGMYDGSYLRLTVHHDGSITKECFMEGHSEFCRLAESAGYAVPGPSRPPRPPTP